jgi:coniferyl-aldehyde dehydrogenase
MAAAAQNLTPVTLELGGKSPALLTRGYPVSEAARRIAHGKTANGGQVCVAPDYALVPREQVDEFVAGVQEAFRAMYAQGADSPDYTSVINERHHARLKAMVADAEAQGARIFSCSGHGDTRKFPLQIVVGCKPGMALMKEEIFGPILPVVAYDTLDQAISHIAAGPRPLALYCFGHDRAEREKVLQSTHSGGVTINDWGWHVFNHDAPFGGIGNSGMGTYHGEEGFRELSHARTVFKRHRWFPSGLFYPPYGNFVQNLVMRVYLGKADPALNQRGE